MKKILIATIDGMIGKDDIKELEKIGQVDWLVKNHIDDIELANIAKDYDYLMLNFDIVEKLSEEFYSIIKGSNLKVISTDITGMDWAKPKIAKEAGIYLLNTSNYCTESVAEYSIMQIMLYAKRANLTYKDIYTSDNIEARKTINLLNKTIGIVGLGNIGTRVAEIANGLGMNVIAYNRTKKNIDNVKMVDLETLFKESDFISIHLKTIPGITEGMITKDLLNHCKKECFIENQADSKLINKEDLVYALKNNLIAGYGATLNDYTRDFKDLDNVILFPANAWFSNESLENLKNIWMNNILEFDKGNIINLVEEQCFIKKILLSLLIFSFIFLFAGCDITNCSNDPDEPEDLKPVLYLYPKEEIKVNVKFEKPDSLLRVNIEIKKLNKKVSIKEQELSTFNRTGFTAIEWGGRIIKQY